MILFRCERCGRAFRVEDRFAGGAADCEHCGHHIRIPQESDPDVVLVFKAGESEEGTPLTRTQVAEAFERGLLRPTDLIFENGMWRPLAKELHNIDNAVIAAELKKNGVRLKLRSRDGSEVLLQELPPIPVRRLKSHVSEAKKAKGEETREKKKAGFRLLRGVEEQEKKPSAATESAGEAAPPRPRKSLRKIRKWTLISIQIGLALVACWYGYRFGIGPLISAMRGLPTRIIVINPVDVPARAVLGWRRLKQDLPATGICTYQLYVAGREHQTLRIFPTRGEPQKYRLLLRPGARIIFNPGGRPLVVLRPGRISKPNLKAEIKRLADEIAANHPPEAIDAIIAKVTRLAKEACREVIRDRILDGAKYAVEGGPAPVPGVKQPPHRLAVGGKPRQFAMGDGWVRFRPDRAAEGNLQSIEAVVRLPNRSLKLHNKFAVKIPANTECRLRRTPSELEGTFEVGRQTVDTRKGKLHGKWSYRALRMLSESRPTWDWAWTFQGEGKVGKKKISVTLTLFRDNPIPRLDIH